MSHALKRAPHLNSPKPRRCRTVPGAHHLLWLALTAIRSPPQCPLLARANRIQRIPEFRGDARIRRILHHARALAILDLPSDLAAKLKVVALVVNRP